MTPRNPEQNEQIREQQAGNIMQAAARLFAKRGFGQTKVSDIAAEAGVSHGLVHHYFDTKADLFATIVRQVMDSATDVPRQALESEGEPIERLRWMLEQMLLGVKYAPEMFTIVVQAQSNEALPDDLRKMVADKGLEALGLIAKLVEEGQAAGQVREGDANVLALHLIGAVQGLSVQRSVDPTEIPGFPDADVVLGIVKK